MTTFRPTLEALEDRTLLSASPAALAPVRLALVGTVSGSWSGGTRQSLAGSGALQTLGPVRAGAQLSLPAPSAQGRATGSLTLGNAHGTVRLQLLGPSARGTGGPILPLAYKVGGGTGGYRGATGSGVVVLTETQAGRAATPAFTLAF
jgi:hypothetical protein